MTDGKQGDPQAGESGTPPPIATDPFGADTIPEGQTGDAAPDLAALLEKAEDEANELKNAWLRARADTENMRKQAQQDVAKAYKYANERFAEELLPVKDSLESTLAAANASPEALRAGVELTLKQLAAAFEKGQIKEVSPAGERFDPHQHQAMSMVDSDQPPNTVVTVLQKGYLLNDRVLRPALVTVAKGGDGNR